MALSDAAGAVTARFRYSAYGALLAGNASLTPFLFNGMYGVMADANGLYHMRARFYSAEIRRFLNRDVLPGNVARGQSLNRFSYTTNRPIAYIDPQGLFADVAVDFIFIGYDLYAIFSDNIFGSEGNFKSNCAALGADVGSLFIPFVTGGGIAVRGSIKLVDNILTPAQKAAFDRIYNIINHNAKKSDFEGVIKELNGINTGWDHITEMKQSVAGLEKSMESITKSLSNPNLSNESRSMLMKALTDAQSMYQKMLNTLSGIQ